MNNKKWYDGLFLNAQEFCYAKQYLKKQMRLSIVFIVILSLFVAGFLIPSSILSIPLELFGGVVYGSQNYYEIYELYGGFELLFICVCALAFLLPLYQFKFLMKRASSDLYLSLPIERKRLFYIHYLMGLFFLIIVTLIETFVFLLFHGVAYQNGTFMIRSFPNIFILMPVFLILGCCYYTFFTLLILKTHTMLDAIMICCIYTVLPLVVYTAITTFIGNVSSDILISAAYSSSQPIALYITALLSIPWQMNRWIYQLVGVGAPYTYEILIACLLVWVVFALFCYQRAKRTFITIKSEESEQPTSSFLTYPLLIPLITFLMVFGYGDGNLFSISIFIGLLVYLVAYFFAKRKVSLEWTKLLLYAGIVLLCSISFHIAVNTKLFGTISEVPDLEDVKSVQLDISQETRVDEHSINQYTQTSQTIYRKESIKKLIAYQEELLPYAENSRDIDEWWKQSYVTFNLSYTCKDGSMMYRTYFFYNEETIQKIEAQLDVWIAEGMIHDFERLQ